MTDSTHGRHRRSFSPLAARASLTILLVALAAAWSAAAAIADGDPASDVLAQQSLFLPQDAGVSAAQQVQLAGLLEAAAASHYAIRVAVIASSSDLGSVTELWKQPENYAEFLGQELALVYRGPLLVIMPHGLGLYHPGQSVAADRLALAALPAPPSGAGLGAVALTSIQRLAAATGHRLSIPNATASTTPRGGHATEWIVFGAGGVLIALAWAASLRAQPLHPRRRRSRPTSAP